MKERKLELADTATVTRYVQGMHDLFSNSSLVERKPLVKSFVKEVKVSGDKALLNYTIPLSPRGIRVEEMTVLSNIHSGGADGIRTHYLLTASQTLSRLSYSPVWFKNIAKRLEKHKLKIQAQPL